MNDDQRLARIFGVLFIITFITSIGALALFQPVLDDPAGYISRWWEGRTRSTWGRSLSCCSSSRTSERPSFCTRSRGVRTRLSRSATSLLGSIECVFIAAGIIFVLGVVQLRLDSPDAADLAVSLAALKDLTFLFGPGLIVPWGNGLILGYLMYKSGLVPRRMAWFGLIGGPLSCSRASASFSTGGTGRHGAKPLGHPGVHLGGVPRHLLRRLGVPARRADPLWRFRSLSAVTSAASPIGRDGLFRGRGSGSWPCRGWCLRCSLLSGGSRAVATLPTTVPPIRTWINWADDNQWKSRIGAFAMLLAGFVFLHFAATIRTALGSAETEVRGFSRTRPGRVRGRDHGHGGHDHGDRDHL